MGDDDREGTPPTGTAIPRPVPVRPERVARAGVTIFGHSGGRGSEGTGGRGSESTEVPVDAWRGHHPAPSAELGPTLRDIYALIDQRLTPEIIERLSSIPPPESRPSRAVQAAQKTGTAAKVFTLGLGVLALAGQGIALWRPEYTGPIVGALKLVLAGAQMLFGDGTPPVP